MECVKGHQADASDRFCPICGANLWSQCPNGHDSPAASQFCTSCGAQLGTPEAPKLAPSTAAHSSGEEDRRSATYWLVIGIGGFALFVILAVVVAVKSNQGLDDSATQACAITTQDSVSVIDILKAIGLAEHSSTSGIREAAATTSPNSDLPFSDPSYQNPGDVEYNAITEWCASNT